MIKEDKTQRGYVLKMLITFSCPIDELREKLSTLNWDDNDSSQNLSVINISNVICKYINNEISEQDVEDWANLIEGREDINYELKNREKIEEVIYQLANPLLTTPFNMDQAKKLLHEISSS